jgi:ABC-type transporter Mla subunit MlaD
LHRDASASIAASGLLGAAYLQIDPGSPEEARLEPRGELRGEIAPGIDSAMAQAAELGARLTALLEQMSSVIDRLAGDLESTLEGASGLLSEENVANAGELLAAMNATMQESGPRLNALLVKLDSLAGRADDGLDDLPRLEAKLETLIDGLNQALGEDGDRLRNLLDTAESSLDSAGGALEVLGANREELETTLRELRDTVSNLKAFSQQIKERPYSLVRIKPPAARRPGEGVE